ncbi:hypothetical protein BDR22DRAFT_823835 [Usnea florida]
MPKAEPRMHFPPEFSERANRVDKRFREQGPEQARPPSPAAKQAEQRAREIRKGKQPEQGWNQHSTHAGTKGKQAEQPIQTFAEGNKPGQPLSQKDPQASLRGISQQLTIRQSIHKDPKTSEPQPKRQEEFEIQIARIPIGKDALIETVKVYISQDTAYSNSQTLIFKHFPNVQFYWSGKRSRDAWATTIVRLEKNGNPTPYFLLVNKGGQLNYRTPRNQNANLTDGQEPIYGDAFVFKLGDPELHEVSGHERYVDIETDVGRISWLPGSIKDAATKVKTAGPANANPGFPDLRKYADPETVKQQASESQKEENYKIMKSVMERMLSVICHGRKEIDFLGTDLDPEADNTISTAYATFRAIKNRVDVNSTDAIGNLDIRLSQMEEGFLNFVKVAEQNQNESSNPSSQVQDAWLALAEEVDRQEHLIRWEAAGLGQVEHVLGSGDSKQ